MSYQRAPVRQASSVVELEQSGREQNVCDDGQGVVTYMSHVKAFSGSKLNQVMKTFLKADRGIKVTSKLQQWDQKRVLQFDL